MLDNDGNVRIVSPADENITFLPGKSEKVRITTGGNVGIGTTSPGAKLEVNGTVAANAFASTSPLIFEAPLGTERMRILDTNGNVGIGTTSPGAKLEVEEPITDFLRRKLLDLDMGGFHNRRIQAGLDGNTVDRFKRRKPL